MFSSEIWEQVIHLYSTEGLTLQATADKTGVKWGSVRNILLKSGFDLNDKKKYSPEQQKEIADKYVEGSSLHKLAKEYKVNPTTIQNVLKKLNVERRPTKDCNWQRWDECPGKIILIGKAAQPLSAIK